ncbi:O-antigen ligase family protein [Aureisphaera sp. CAU 1614]|uniref:O-antigen ligase family protein n=1 Tax=Halomarinibacterium sedimenti TaxID=2857106 RepID=A0A9X1JWP8_9FLAO|nr:O-antigen ligase family protein [Halomarinibacterium sedimenti]MBW2937248.1 O-antigen ligase family protein [Halomarinibacterium sedimenti]
MSIVILSSPLLISVLGSFYTSNPDGAFKDIGRLFPLALLVPVIIYNTHFFTNLLKKLLYSLALGCLISALVCWGLSLYEIWQTNGTIGDLFSQAYAYHFLSERVGIHTPYLGLFVAVSLFFLILEGFHRKSKQHSLAIALWALVLFFFLINLLARTALFTVISGALVFFIYHRKYFALFLITSLIASLGMLAYYQDENFLRDRIFKSINIFEEQTIFSKKDDRFSRYSASIEVFKKFPLFGPGTAGEDIYRKEVYFKNRDSEAYNDNYNAHNQFLEYLSTYGIMGGLVFIMILYLLCKEGVARKDSFTLFLVYSFVVASITESILERSWGLSFYILMLIFIYGNNNIINEIR